MIRMRPRGALYFQLLVLVTILGFVLGDPLYPGASGSLVMDGTLQKKRCVNQRAYKRPATDCSNMNLNEIPHNLKSDMEIFVASFNRIRELHNDTFTRYTSIKFLYLGDNMIRSIEPGTFEPLSELEVLDLSLNSLTTIPQIIFQLPYLRKLYLFDNDLSHLNNNLKDLVKPIAAPLQYLNLANCKLSGIPSLGLLPDLLELNVSGNPFTELAPLQFAPMCALNLIDLNNTHLTEKIGYCGCRIVEHWLIEHKATIENGMEPVCYSPNERDIDYSYCLEDQDLNQTTVIYDECRSIINLREKDKTAKTTWIAIAGSVAICIILIISVLFWLHRRNKKQSRVTNKPHAEENANTEGLLISN